MKLMNRHTAFIVPNPPDALSFKPSSAWAWLHGIVALLASRVSGCKNRWISTDEGMSSSKGSNEVHSYMIISSATSEWKKQAWTFIVRTTFGETKTT